jgi:uncharacterized protein YutE (UPF0331/DUF86 family)
MKQEFKERVIKHLKFLEDEFQDYAEYAQLTWNSYQRSRCRRREIERWVENLVNSVIDIAKVIILSEGLNIPETYREIVSYMKLIKGFEGKMAEQLSAWTKLRNVITHEYLDLKWNSIENFIKNAEPVYENFIDAVKKYLAGKLEEEKNNS